MAKYSMKVLKDGRRRVTVALIAPDGRTVNLSRDSKGRSDLGRVAGECAQFAADVRSGKITGRGGAGEPREVA